MTALKRVERLSHKAKELSSDTYALYLAARDPRVPRLAKLIAWATAAYALSPIDLIPDFIPVLGMLDDLVVVPLGLSIAIRMIPREIMDEHRAAARDRLARGNPRRRSGVFIVIGIWVCVAALVVILVTR